MPPSDPPPHPDPSPAPAPLPPSPPRGGSRFWRQFASTQELGLVAVIVAIMAFLTLWTPNIPKGFDTPQPAEAQIAATPAGDGFTITTGGATTTYLEADGYSFRGAPGNLIVVQTREVNRFLNRDNLFNILTSASFIAVMAVGMTGIIIMGGIDLSVGSIYALAAVIGAMVLTGEPDRLPWIDIPRDAGALTVALVGLLTCCGIGAACGLLNGVATVGLRVHPFIITLGGMAVYRGLAFVTTKGQSIGDFPSSFGDGTFRANLLGVTPGPFLVMLLVGVVGAFVLSRTVFGRRTYAIGGNETAARYAGIPVGTIKVLLFAISGTLAGLAAWMMLGYYGAAASNAGSGYELNVIAAAVVGGASLSGGRGSAIGAVLGAIVIQLIENSIQMLEIDQNYREIVIGVAIVLAVVVDQAKHRLSQRR